MIAGGSPRVVGTRTEMDGDHSRTAPARESRLQPVPAAHRLKPGFLGRCPVSVQPSWMCDRRQPPVQTVSQSAVLGSRFSVLSSRFSVLSSQFSVLSSPPPSALPGAPVPRATRPVRGASPCARRGRWLRSGQCGRRGGRREQHRDVHISSG